MAEQMWRSGKLLVCTVDAVFPDRCVKTNQPVGRSRWRQSLIWHHPLYHLLHVVSSRAHAAATGALERKVVLRVGLSPEWQRKCQRSRMITLALLLSSVTMLALSFFTNVLPNSNYGAAVGGFGLIIGFLYDRIAGRLLVAKKITNRHIWIKGVCTEFLAELPEWPCEV